MKHLAYAAMQLLFFWVFLILYALTMIPLAVVVGLLSPVFEKREKK